METNRSLNSSESFRGNATGMRDQDSPRQFYGPSISCGYCDTTCIYGAIETIFVIGILGNIVVIYRVVKDSNLHDPTFVSVAALALADVLFLILNLTSSFESVILTITCNSPVIISKPFYILKSILWFGANSHVALLAVLRYTMMAYPLRAFVFLSVPRVIALSAGVWILGIILMGTLTALISDGLILPGKSQEFIIVLWITVYLIPLIVTIILHMVKLLVLHKSTKESATELTRNSIQRMSRIVLIVIIMAAVLPLPRLINSYLKISKGYAYPSVTFKIHFGAIADLLFLANHAINPFIYAFMSHRFHRSLEELCKCLRFARSAEQDTLETPISSTRSNAGTSGHIEKKVNAEDLSDIGTLIE